MAQGIAYSSKCMYINRWRNHTKLLKTHLKTIFFRSLVQWRPLKSGYLPTFPDKAAAYWWSLAITVFCVGQIDSNCGVIWLRSRGAHYARAYKTVWWRWVVFSVGKQFLWSLRKLNRPLVGPKNAVRFQAELRDVSPRCKAAGARNWPHVVQRF
jgi:hypothetical protein